MPSGYALLSCTGWLLHQQRPCTSLRLFRPTAGQLLGGRRADATPVHARQLPCGIRCKAAAATSADAPSKTSSSKASSRAGYEPVIGIEVHVQLSTATKAFCSCANVYGASPNTHVCPVCMGLPGTLPTLTDGAVHRGLMAGLALGCKINKCSKFDRKQYFYPDLPKGYQISQYDAPLCEHGHIDVTLPDGSSKRVGITRAHLEEDAGKIVYSGADSLANSDYGLVDYNRAGVPLLEIVSEPDMRSAAEAAAYGMELRRIMRYIGASDGNMAEGAMRCDVNVSVRPTDREQFGTRVEIKNMNSFGNMQMAIEYEVDRHIQLLESGQGDSIVQETRLWDEKRKCTVSMRKKEGLADYRYFPEPDLPPLEVSDARVASTLAALPELPTARRARYKAMDLQTDTVLTLADEAATGNFFDAVLAAGASAKAAANYLVGDVMAYLKENKVALSDIGMTPGMLAEMLQLLDDGVISGKICKEVLPDMLAGKVLGSVKEYVESKDLVQISDPTAIAAMIDRVLEANPKQLEQYRAGKTKLQGFFVGQLMKESQGRANPSIMNKLLLEKLKGDG